MAMALRGPELSTMDVTRRDWALARELDLRISIHVGSGAFGVPYRAIEQLDAAGLMGPDVQYVHATSLSDAAVGPIAATGGTAVVTPAVELQMGYGWPATTRLLAHGVPTGLGVDVVTSTGADLFGQMRAAYQVGRALALADGESRGAGADTSNVDTVVVAGRVVKRDGRLLHADLARARRLAVESGAYVLRMAGVRAGAVAASAD